MDKFSDHFKDPHDIDQNEIEKMRAALNKDDNVNHHTDANDHHSAADVKNNDDLNEDIEYKWHVVNVAKNSEISLRNSLLNFADLYKIKRIYIPMEKIKRWKNQEQIQEIKPAMNYLFVLCPLNVLNDRFLKHQVKNRYSVISTISDSEVKKMEKEFENLETIIDTSLSEGSRVYILKGSFSGLHGQIQKVDGSIAEVKVWLMEDCEPTNIIVPLSDLIRQSDYDKNY